MMASCRLWVFGALLLSNAAPTSKAISAAERTVILVSFDASRWDVMSLTDTPNFDKIVQKGVKTYVHSVFPTVTFTNHYTIATGLYPESHGIIGNNIYDPVWNANFTMANSESRWWNDGEPIWVTNQRQGFQSGLCFWPGYDVKIRGYFPTNSTRNLGYDKPFLDVPSMNWTDRVDIVIDWLTQEKPVSFAALYFNSPDMAGHEAGPDSMEFRESIRRNDNITGYLLRRLQESGLEDKVNLLITGDHGMSGYNATSVVNLDKYVNQSLYSVWSWSSTFFMVNPRHVDNHTALYTALRSAEAKETGKLKVYLKEEFPVELHFANNRRVAEFLVVMNKGYVAATSKHGNLHMAKNVTRGAHGYLPVKDMNPFFIAYGPAFKEGYNADPFDMVNIYSLICHILGIEPAPNNGSLTGASDLLKEYEVIPYKPSHMSTLVLLAVIIGSCVMFGSCIACVYRYFKRKHERLRWVQGLEGEIPLMADESDSENVFS